MRNFIVLLQVKTPCTCNWINKRQAWWHRVHEVEVQLILVKRVHVAIDHGFYRSRVLWNFVKGWVSSCCVWFLPLGPTGRRGIVVPHGVCLSVCLSVCERVHKGGHQKCLIFHEKSVFEFSTNFGVNKKCITTVTEKYWWFNNLLGNMGKINENVFNLIVTSG